MYFDQPGIGSALRITAEILHVRPQTVRKYWKMACGGGTASVAQAIAESKDGRGNARDGQRKIKQEHYRAIDRLIQTELVQKELYITGQGVVDLIKDHLSIEVCKRTADRVLNKLGYRYKKLRKQ